VAGSCPCCSRLANPQLFALLDAIRVHDGTPGRPRKMPDMLIADKAYSHDPTRREPRRRGIAHIIPERVDQAARRTAKGSHGGRPPDFDKQIYRQRNVV
jgi:transposase